MQSLASGGYRSEADGRSTGSRTRRESRRLHHCRFGSTSRGRSSLGNDSHPNLKISIPKRALKFRLPAPPHLGGKGLAPATKVERRSSSGAMTTKALLPNQISDFQNQLRSCPMDVEWQFPAGSSPLAVASDSEGRARSVADRPQTAIRPKRRRN